MLDCVKSIGVAFIVPVAGDSVISLLYQHVFSSYILHYFDLFYISLMSGIKVNTIYAMNIIAAFLTQLRSFIFTRVCYTLRVLIHLYPCMLHTTRTHSSLPVHVTHYAYSFIFTRVCYTLRVLIHLYPIKNYRGLSPNYRGQRWAYVHFIGGAAIYPIIYP